MEKPIEFSLLNLLLQVWRCRVLQNKSNSLVGFGVYKESSVYILKETSFIFFLSNTKKGWIRLVLNVDLFLGFCRTSELFAMCTMVMKLSHLVEDWLHSSVKDIQKNWLTPCCGRIRKIEGVVTVLVIVNPQWLSVGYSGWHRNRVELVYSCDCAA